MGDFLRRLFGGQPDQIAIEEWLKKNKAAGVPTYTDTPGMGNVVPWQFPGTSFHHNERSQMNEDRLNALHTRGGAGPQRYNLERFLNEAEIRQFQDYINRSNRNNVRFQ